MKRLFDILCVLCFLPLWLPLLLGTAIFVRLKLGSPVLFKQARPGYQERIFQLYKFRSMTDERDASGQLLPDVERLPAFGRWLRSTSLDELPSLWNILRGELSLVGPRPLHVAYLDRYSEQQRRRHQVPPGLTGWAQINGRNAQSWEERFQHDLWYVENRSFVLDLRILFLTVFAVLQKKGTEPMMKEFKGSDKEQN